MRHRAVLLLIALLAAAAPATARTGQQPDVDEPEDLAAELCARAANARAEGARVETIGDAIHTRGAWVIEGGLSDKRRFRCTVRGDVVEEVRFGGALPEVSPT